LLSYEYISAMHIFTCALMCYATLNITEENICRHDLLAFNVDAILELCDNQEKYGTVQYDIIIASRSIIYS